jgi:hypothetical protein
MATEGAMLGKLLRVKFITGPEFSERHEAKRVEANVGAGYLSLRSYVRLGEVPGVLPATRTKLELVTRA